MRKIYLLILLSNALSMYAQERNITTTIRHGQNSRYQYDTKFNFTRAYRQGSVLTYDRLSHKDGTEIPELVYWGYIPVMEITNEQILLMQKIVDDAVMAETETGDNLLEELKGQDMLVSVFFNSTTGVVMEVSYQFRRVSPLYNAPVEIFCNIENMIRDRIMIRPTPEGERFTFLLSGWMHTIGQTIDASTDYNEIGNEGEAEETEEEEEEPPVVEPPIHP